MKIPLLYPILSAGWWLILIGSLLVGSWLWRLPRERVSPANLILGILTIGIGLVARSYDDTHALKWGGIPVSPALMGFVGLSVAGSWFMARSAGRGRVIYSGLKAVGVQAIYLTLSLVFAFPLLWMVLTSLRDSSDLARSGAVVLVPKVQDTQFINDPLYPYFEVRHDNILMKVNRIEAREGGKSLVEVVEPKALAGSTFVANQNQLKVVPRPVPVVMVKGLGQGLVAEELPTGAKRIRIGERDHLVEAADIEPVMRPGLKWENYVEVASYLPPDTQYGLRYLQNTLYLALLSVVGTLLSSSLAAYGFARFEFPGKNGLFLLLLSTLMLPGAVTLLPTFLIFKQLGWIDTLNPLWVPAWFGSAFNIFLLRQFFSRVPQELEQAATIDGCGPLRIYWSVLLPQIKPALITLAIGGFVGTWNNFQGPLLYTNSVEKMPLAYGLQLFVGDRSGEPALLLAASVLVLLPILALYFFTQKYFMEQLSLSGMGGT